MVFCMAWQEVCRGASSRSSGPERRHSGVEPLHPLKQVTHKNRNFLSRYSVTNSAKSERSFISSADQFRARIAFFLGFGAKFIPMFGLRTRTFFTLLHCQTSFALLVQVFQAVRAQILEEILGNTEQVDDHPLLQEISRLQTRCEDLTQLQKVFQPHSRTNSPTSTYFIFKGNIRTKFKFRKETVSSLYIYFGH